MRAQATDFCSGCDPGAIPFVENPFCAVPNGFGVLNLAVLQMPTRRIVAVSNLHSRGNPRRSHHKIRQRKTAESAASTSSVRAQLFNPHYISMYQYDMLKKSTALKLSDCHATVPSYASLLQNYFIKLGLRPFLRSAQNAANCCATLACDSLRSAKESAILRVTMLAEEAKESTAWKQL